MVRGLPTDFCKVVFVPDSPAKINALGHQKKITESSLLNGKAVSWIPRHVGIKANETADPLGKVSRGVCFVLFLHPKPRFLGTHFRDFELLQALQPPQTSSDFAHQKYLSP